jgi:hypothetical protein
MATKVQTPAKKAPKASGKSKKSAGSVSPAQTTPAAPEAPKSIKATRWGRDGMLGNRIGTRGSCINPALYTAKRLLTLAEITARTIFPDPKLFDELAPAEAREVAQAQKDRLAAFFALTGLNTVNAIAQHVRACANNPLRTPDNAIPELRGSPKPGIFRVDYIDEAGARHVVYGRGDLLSPPCDDYGVPLTPIKSKGKKKSK